MSGLPRMAMGAVTGFNPVAFILSNPWRTACIVLVAALSFAHFWTIPHLHGEVTSLNQQLTTDKVLIGQQNDAVTEWKRQTNVAREAQKQALVKANKAMVVKEKIVTRILKVPVPTPAKECDSTLALLKEFQ